jgi:hypothetical protein
VSGHGRLVAVVVSLAVGTAIGLGFAAAPAIAGDTAVTDPVALGVMWFVRPRTVLVIVPPLIHLAVGAGIGMLATTVRVIDTTLVVLAAVAVNGAATLVENAYGAGVVGVLWWLLGSVISAALMLLGAAIAKRVTDTWRPTREATAKPS